MTHTMKAQLINQCGAPTVFYCADLPIPKPNANQVLIKLHATSVNPIETKFRAGHVGKLHFPALLHSDFAGKIIATGELVTQFILGDAVFGNAGAIAGTGTLAEYALADARLVATAPKSIPLHHAAALPLVSITAWEALFDKAQIKPWHQVLIQGGAGGVGHIATQLAKWAGCEVWASASPSKHHFLHTFGANPIDYHEQQAFDQAKAQTIDELGFDVVFDTVGRASLDKAIEMARPNGTAVAIAGRSEHNLQLVHEKNLDLKFEFKTLGTINEHHRAHQGWILRHISRLVDQQKITPIIDETVFTLETVGEAHAYLESGQATGKVVIKITN
ncbi:zinc-binding dehydrogenase [Cardiobacteriales bacterium ML27]|uniref:Zinc-binding dehydrogenase n=2 Tax=Ostreibacterium oceani TaxID=2654998 RepID=A0A6N7EYD6_9GAMM|nr:zinc-binding dehydrogenase [Ostreibacterium oceani]